MKIIGLTGQSGAGKGMFASALRQYGIPCLDTDITARSVVEKDKPCLGELTECFGADILFSDGTLDRKKLGKIVFSDKTALARLNSITHKYITEQVKIWLKKQEASGFAAAVIDAPQLFESGENSICDITVAVLCDEETRIARIISRDNITQAYAKARAASQKDDAFFKANCDHIIYNNGTEAELAQKALEFLHQNNIPVKGE